MTNEELARPTTLGATLEDLLTIPVQAQDVPLGAIAWNGAGLSDVIGFHTNAVILRDRRTQVETTVRGVVRVVVLQSQFKGMPTHP